ncbi:MAG: hypothetical protein GX548_13135 [Lentisphaerae bacterium]|nr:hypothetical protein [Lentisphaerota bacterium]
MKYSLALGLLAISLSSAWATPPNTAILDGWPLEYHGDDWRGSHEGPSTWGDAGTLTNLFVTWDDTYLYVALQAWQNANNKFVVLIDADPGAGTGATTTTNWTGISPDYIRYNDYGWVDGGTFGLDLMVASEGFYNNAIRILYDGIEPPSTNNTESLFDRGNGGSPALTPVDMASRGDTSACLLKGFEARIPWSVLYEGTRWGTVESGETVPRGATLRLLAGIHNNDPASAWSSPDTIPNQIAEDYTNGIVTTATYLDVPVDSDNDGLPDMLGIDVNPPWIRAASGSAGQSYLAVAFSEPVTPATVENTANWSVGGAAPVSASALNAQVVLLGLAAPIASTDQLALQAVGVEDLSANSRTNAYCFHPAASGIPLPVDVTFVVLTNSGMGVSSSHARPNAFYVNGGILPLEWNYPGYPPFETTPLAPIPGSNGWASATVTFPRGSPSELFYKFSARISTTNTYEAIRLTDFGAAARPLSLPTDGTPVTVVDHLGAAAYPLRIPGDTNPPSAQNRLYSDARRGDAGVRVRREILFQLDLSMRRHDHLTRVMVLGSDPLRGFNDTGNNAGGTASDYPDNSAYVDWTNAGIELFDDATHGDTAAGDGIFSRLWAFSTNGLDAAIVTNAPHSLVGGRAADWLSGIPGTQPYQGDLWWTAGRSPRDIIYKFSVLTSGGAFTNSPAYNLSHYVADPDATDRIVLDPFVWDNDFLPPPPPSNAPALSAVTHAGGTSTIRFQNVPTEAAHGVKIAANLPDGFQDYGHRAVMGEIVGEAREWTASIAQASGTAEYYAPYAGPEPDPLPHFWEPSFIPAGETIVRIHFSQYQSNLKGGRTLSVTGPFAAWGLGTPMTFLGDGHWMADVELSAGSESVVEYKIRNGDAWLDGNNIRAVRGGPATWTPDQPDTGDVFAVTFDAAGTTLATATNVNIHLGFDSEAWSDRPMTNTAGAVWEYAVTIPTNAAQSVNWVFNGFPDGSTNLTWYSSADWKAFLQPLVNP